MNDYLNIERMNEVFYPFLWPDIDSKIRYKYLSMHKARQHLKVDDVDGFYIDCYTLGEGLSF